MRVKWEPDPTNVAEVTTVYRVEAQALHDDGSCGEWERCGAPVGSREEAEAAAESLCRDQKSRDRLRHNYRVVQVVTRAVRIYLAPMRAG